MKKWLVWGGILVVALWVGIALLIGFAATVLWPDLDPERLGQFGDTFGAASALFAGLGSLGVGIVLAYDLRHRKEEFRPFVSFAVGEVKLSRATYGGGPHFAAEIDLNIDLASVTAAPALNLQMVAVARAASETFSGIMELGDSPLATGDTRTASVNFTAVGSAAKALVQAINDNGVLVDLVATYEALNATGWESIVTFRLSAKRADTAQIAETLDPASGRAVDRSSTTEFATRPYFLEAEPVPGTWKQSRRTAVASAK